MMMWIGRAGFWGVTAALVCTGGCTSANPNYQVGDSVVVNDVPVSFDGSQMDGKGTREAGRKDAGVFDAVRRDKSGNDARRDDGPGRDASPREDARPEDTLSPDTLSPDTLSPDTLSPDTEPPACQYDWQCNDYRSCTRDRCSSGHCTNVLLAGYCLIGNTCRGEGWSDAGDVCNECVTAVSTSALTFVAGKACGSRGMCLKGGCREWKTRPDVEPSLGTGHHAESTILESVDAVGGGEDVWAVGRYKDTLGRNGGLLRRLDTSTTPSVPVAVLTSKGLSDLSYGLAVGDGGIAYHYDKGKWKAQTAIETALNGVDRLGVWGGVGTQQSEVYYLSGGHSQTGIHGVVRCTVKGNGASCVNEYGFQTKEILGPIFGVVSGKQQRLWTLRQRSTYDDIYSRGTASSAWSAAPPAGCLDSAQGSGNRACSNTRGDFRALYAASLTETWIVGDNGLVLRYQGATGWKRMSSLPSGVSTSTYNLTAVYASAVEGLVTVVGYTDIGGVLRRVGIFNYNLKLARWLGPIVIENLVITGSGGNDPGRIRHLGGSGYDNLWMVGDRWKLSSYPSRRVGWVLSLE